MTNQKHPKYRVYSKGEFYYFEIGKPFKPFEFTAYQAFSLNNKQFDLFSGEYDEEGKEIYQRDLIIDGHKNMYEVKFETGSFYLKGIHKKGFQNIESIDLSQYKKSKTVYDYLEPEQV